MVVLWLGPSSRLPADSPKCKLWTASVVLNLNAPAEALQPADNLHLTLSHARKVCELGIISHHLKVVWSGRRDQLFAGHADLVVLGSNEQQPDLGQLCILQTMQAGHDRLLSCCRHAARQIIMLLQPMYEYVCSTKRRPKLSITTRR